MNKEIFAAYHESMLAQLRSNRNLLLRDTDWTQMPDALLSGDKKAEYATYRQSLRDLTENSPDPLNVVWPVKPE